jgi:type VI secretion system protein ImpF
MAELTVKERLQPSLLDRLTDDEPQKKVESRDRRVISLEKLRECVLRDLGWLLNTGRLSQVQDLGEYPEVARSVVNYGSIDLSGRHLSSTDLDELESAVKQAILDFEPRILPDTLRVRSVLEGEKMSSTAITFTIEGSLWAQPLPLRMFLHTEVDLESGHVAVLDQSSQ